MDSPSTLSPEREHLREAIEDHAAAVRRLDAISVVEQAKLAARTEKREALANALAEAAKAETDVARRAAAVGVKEARQTLDAAVAEQLDIRNQRTTVEKEVRLAASELANRVRDVVRSDPATEMLAVEFAELQRQIAELRPVMELLSGMMPARFRFWRAEPGPPPHSVRRDTWDRAIAALQSDAGAELPH